MLVERYGFHKIRELNLPVEGFRPFPKHADRSEWESAAPETAKRWISAAEELLGYEWPPVAAQMYLRPRATGEFGELNSRFRERRDALGFLAFAECFEGKGRFVGQIINGIVAICEETSWSQVLAFAGIGFDIPLPSDREVDLTTSETAALLAWIDYLLGEPLDRASGRVRRRLRDTVRERVLEPYLDRDDYWWMGFEKGHRINNWNPWCNLNAIICFLLLDDDAQRRARGLHRAIMSLDRYLESYSGDGCCDEGPMYWGAAGAGLFDCLNLLWEASGGAVDATDLEKLRLIGEYIAKVHIHGDYYVNYADGDAIVKSGSSTYRFGKALKNTGMMALGSKSGPLLPIRRDWFSTYAFLNEIFTEKERAACPHAPQYPAQAWFGEKGVLVARAREGTEKGLFLSAKAGDNVESHNHNDVGSFIVYADGLPLLIDIGTEEYRAQTFNEHRYELWYTQSQYHNCPGVRGALQRVGAAYRASGAEFRQDGGPSLSMELAGTYPEDAGILSLRREISLRRDSPRSPCTVALSDRFELSEATDEIFQYFMAACRPERAGDGRIAFKYGGGKTALLLYDAELMAADVEEYPLSESRLRRNWGGELFRIALRAKKPAKSLESRVSILIDESADSGSGRTAGGALGNGQSGEQAPAGGLGGGQRSGGTLGGEQRGGGHGGALGGGQSGEQAPAGGLGSGNAQG
ncbi:MAG: heparinase II/III-family protein [Clostridiales bacterium]|jgi:hypothetical protein|nr:heparinase II/III-family protein [Clostridiales bacterium]